MRCNRIQYVYKFCNYNIIRTLNFNGVKWEMTVTKEMFAYSQKVCDKMHFSKESLSHDFYNMFPECHNVDYSVTKIFTNS